MKSHQLKQLAAATLEATLPLNYILSRLKNRYILAYHRVIPYTLAKQYNMQNSMWITPETFENDISWLKQHGEIVDLETILNFDTPNTKPLFSITFDDGWIDNYEYAFPILNKHDIPSTIFLVTHNIETGNIFWVEDFLYKIANLSNYRLKSELHTILKKHYALTDNKPPDNANTNQLAEDIAEHIKPFSREKREAFLQKLYLDLDINTKPLNGHIMNWSNIIEMSKSGIDFGSHTHTHEILQYASDETILSELETSRNIIEQKIGKPVRYFCYPNARYREDNSSILDRAGYEYSFRIHNLHATKTQDNHFIPRFLLNERVCQNKSYLLCRLLGIPKF